jgi:cation:H+ antiporter
MTRSTSLVSIFVATLFSIPGFGLRLFHAEVDPLVSSVITGTAILSASFLLLWACDAAQQDVSQALALAVVALIAVLPEYAVDMYFTWQAGQYPESDYAHYAIANMTGANRLLIGVGWTLIAVICWFKHGRAVELDPERRTEVLFLGLATVYAFLIPLKGTLAWYDSIVFVGIFAWYISLVSRRPKQAAEVHGPSVLLAALPKPQRLLATGLMFMYAAGVILAHAEPFSEGLVNTGKVLGIQSQGKVGTVAICPVGSRFQVAL